MFGQNRGLGWTARLQTCGQVRSRVPNPAVYQGGDRNGVTWNKLPNPMQLRWDASVEIRAPQVHGTRPKCMRSTSLKANPSNAESVRTTLQNNRVHTPKKQPNAAVMNAGVAVLTYLKMPTDNPLSLLNDPIPVEQHKRSHSSE